MLKIKCLNCKKEIDSIEVDGFHIKISNDSSYRYGHFFLCYTCSGNSNIYHSKTIFDALEIILKMNKK